MIIPSKQVINKIAKTNKDYELDFVNAQGNNDVYTLKIFLRHTNSIYKLRLVLTGNVLSYPALTLNWVFEDNEYELASRVFHRICDEADELKLKYDRSTMPASTLAAQIREAVRPISSKHQEKSNIPFVDEAAKLPGVSDWRDSIYRGDYPG